MKKRLIAMALAVLMVFSLVACSGEKPEATKPAGDTAAPTQEPSGEAGKQTLKIGMAWAILDDGQTNLTNGIKACFENNFPEYNIDVTLTNADGDIAKLIDDVDSLIAMEPDMIYIMNSVGESGIIPAIDACVAANIPVGIGVALADEANYTYLYEGFSQYACGQMQAEYMESIYDESATYNVACIGGDAGNVAGQERVAGFKENFVDVHDNVNVVIEGEGNWKTDDAQKLAEDWLIAHPEINVISCVNDDEAQGVINACKAAGREDVIILGIDASDVGRGNVDSGDQDVTVAIDFFGVASACAQAMVDCALGNLTGDVILTTENLDLYTKG